MASLVHDESSFDDEDSVKIIENAMKQVAFASNTGGNVNDQVLAHLPLKPTTRPEHDNTVQLRMDDRGGGPDFKAQTDSRSHLVDSTNVVVRAQQQLDDGPADFYGQAAHVNVQRTQEREDHPVAMVAAVVPRSRKRAQKIQKGKSRKPKATTFDKRLLLLVVSLGILFNMLLAAGVSSACLFLMGSFRNEEPALEPAEPTLFPTPLPIPPMESMNVTSGASETGRMELPNVSLPIMAFPGIASRPSPSPWPLSTWPSTAEYMDDNFAAPPETSLSDFPPEEATTSFGDRSNTPPTVIESTTRKSPVIVAAITLVAIATEVAIVLILWSVYRRWKKLAVVEEESTLQMMGDEA